MDGAIAGLAQGVTSVGLNYLVEKMDVNPLLANIGFSAISTGIEGLINGNGIFKNMFNSYKQNALTMLGINSTPDKMDAKFYRTDANGDIIPGTFNENLYNSTLKLRGALGAFNIRALC